MYRYTLMLILIGGCTASLIGPGPPIPRNRFASVKEDPVADLWYERTIEDWDNDVSRFDEGPQSRIGNTYRLPNDTRPESYDVTLQTRVDINDFAITGFVTIVILVNNDTQTITLHQRQLILENVRLFTIETNPREISVIGTDFNSTYDEVYITTAELLIQQNRYRLQIAYVGTLRTDQGGFYRSSYVAQTGERRYLATTQFESTNARHGFPCYDEPQLKATFTIRITHGPSYWAVSNMPVRSTTSNTNGTITTEFETTPVMSTYLVAFIVSDFAYYQSNEVAGFTPQRVYSRPTAIQLTHLALGAGVKILDELGKFVNINYTLPKMDQFAIPDFAAGAMENWGIVTYREPRFFFDDRVDTYLTRVSIVTVIAHEYGHQWFGNLVGPQWWTYIWLNEGFATLLEYYGTHLAYPEWHYLDLFVSTEMHNVFVRDAEPTIRYMSYYQESPSGISNLFDSIAYDKSGCVLRMFLHAFEETTFRKGLNYYLNARAYNYANEDDLFAGLERAVKEDRTLPAEYNVREIFSSWSRQSGFPLLNVTRNNVTNTITLSQQRYLTNSSLAAGTNSWWIPLNYATASRPDFTSTTAELWLPRGNNSITFPATSFGNISSNQWIVFNKQQGFYYRVLYDTNNYRLIAEELFSGNLDNIHYLSRTNIIDDAFKFAATDRLTYDVVFDIIKYMTYEPEYAPFVPLTSSLTTIHRMLSGSPKYDILKQFIAGLFNTLFDRIGVEDRSIEPIVDKYARTIAINWACYMGNENCLNEASKRIEEFARTGRDIGQNVRSVLYCSGIRNASTSAVHFIWDQLLSSPTGSAIRSTYLEALSCSFNTTFLREYLESSIQTTFPYTTTERDNIFKAVHQSGPQGLNISLQFVIDNIDRIQSFYSQTVFSSSLGTITQRIVSLPQQELYNRFKTAILGRNYATEAQLNNSDITIANNFAWLDKYQLTIETWLDENIEVSGGTQLMLSVVTIILATFLSLSRIFSNY